MSAPERPEQPEQDLALELQMLRTRLHWLIAVVCLLAVAVVWREGVVRSRLAARSFVLVDESGAERGLWRTWGADTRFVMTDTAGHWSINLHVGDGGHTATIFGPDEETEAVLTTVNDAPALKLSRGGSDLVLAIEPDGSPVLTAHGADGVARTIIPMAERR